MIDHATEDTVVWHGVVAKLLLHHVMYVCELRQSQRMWKPHEGEKQQQSKNLLPLHNSLAYTSPCCSIYKLWIRIPSKVFVVMCCSCNLGSQLIGLPNFCGCITLQK